MDDGAAIAVSEETKSASAARIPRNALVAWTSELSEWTPTDVFRAHIDQIAQAIPRNTFFRQGGLAFLRDAWIASRVAWALPSDMVRLVSSERPDFEIQIGGQIEQFEATEADIEGRRRGDEPDDPYPQPDPVENWRRRFEAIPEALDRVVAKKLKKDYLPEVNLAIYVNLGCYGAYVNEGLPILRDHTPCKNQVQTCFCAVGRVPLQILGRRKISIREMAIRPSRRLLISTTPLNLNCEHDQGNSSKLGIL